MVGANITKTMMLTIIQNPFENNGVGIFILCGCCVNHEMCTVLLLDVIYKVGCTSLPFAAVEPFSRAEDISFGTISLMDYDVFDQTILHTTIKLTGDLGVAILDLQVCIGKQIFARSPLLVACWALGLALDFQSIGTVSTQDVSPFTGFNSSVKINRHFQTDLAL